MILLSKTTVTTDTLDIFLVMNELDFKMFAQYVGMKSGHLKRLQNAVFSMKRRDRQVINLTVLNSGSGERTAVFPMLLSRLLLLHLIRGKVVVSISHTWFQTRIRHVL